MTRFLGRFDGAGREVAHYKLVLMFNDLDQLMYVASLMRDRKASDRIFDAFADLYWRGLFDTVPQGRRAPSRRSYRRSQNGTKERLRWSRLARPALVARR